VWEIIVYQQKFVINRYKKISINGKKDSAPLTGTSLQGDLWKEGQWGRGLPVQGGRT